MKYFSILVRYRRDQNCAKCVKKRAITIFNLAPVRCSILELGIDNIMHCTFYTAISYLLDKTISKYTFL